MALITLTSDMGLKDYYVASIKGAILSQCPNATIIDISHNVPAFDIAQASFILRNSYFDFPAGTIHIISVNPEEDEDTAHLVVKHHDQYFVAADNGIFSLMFDGPPKEIFILNISQESDQLTFPTKHVFVKAACHLARGGTPEVIGKKTKNIKERSQFRAVVNGSELKGAVIFIDSYGNVVTNIDQKTFNSVGKGRPFTIFFKLARYDIKKIDKKYNDVPEGEKVALFSAAGFLEIAINRGVEGSGGGANKLFGLKMYDTIRVEFSN